MRHPLLAKEGDILRCDPDFTGYRATVASVVVWKPEKDPVVASPLVLPSGVPVPSTPSKMVLAVGPFTHLMDAVQSGWRAMLLAHECAHLVLVHSDGITRHFVEDARADVRADQTLLLAAKLAQTVPLFIACAGGRSRSVALATALIRLGGHGPTSLGDALDRMKKLNPWAEPCDEPLRSFWKVADDTANQVDLLYAGPEKN